MELTLIPVKKTWWLRWPFSTCKSVKYAVLSDWPPLWSSGQSSWLQIQRSGFNSWRYQSFWEVVGVELGPLSLMSTIEELLGRRNCGSGQETWEYGRRGSIVLTTQHPVSAKLPLTSPTCGGRLVSIVSSRIKATEFCFVCWIGKLSGKCLPIQNLLYVSFK
jgi:hypothetical protein